MNCFLVLMVAGFYFCQISAINIVSIVNKPYSTYFHISLHLGAIASLLTGLVAVFQAIGSKEAHLTSLHSWYGIAAACIYITNMLLGLIKVNLAVNSEKHDFFVALHRFLGFSSVVISCIAISSGIVLYTGGELCTYSVSEYQWNPAGDYENKFPRVCQLTHGLGIIVLAAALLTVYSIFMHFNELSLEKLKQKLMRTSDSALQRPSMNYQPQSSPFAYPEDKDGKKNFIVPKTWEI